MVLYRRFRDSTVDATMASTGSRPAARVSFATSAQRQVIWPYRLAVVGRACARS